MRAAALPARPRSPDGAAVHLSHAGPDQGLHRRQEGHRQPQPVVLPGRQDRRARPERRRQVDGAEDHGRPRQGVRRRGVALRGRHGRLPAAGAGTRPGQGRGRQRHGGRRRQAGAPRPLQRTDDELLRRDRGGGDRASGADRRAESLGPRCAGRAGDGRARLPAERFRRRQSFRRREAPRRALPAAAPPARPAAARRAHQPSRRRDGGVAGKALARISGRHPDRHPRPLLPRQRHRLDPRTRSRPRHSLRRQLLGLS